MNNKDSIRIGLCLALVQFEKFLPDLPAGSYALPKFFESLIHKHLLHGTAAGTLAKQF